MCVRKIRKETNEKFVIILQLSFRLINQFYLSTNAAPVKIKIPTSSSNLLYIPVRGDTEARKPS